MSDQSQDFSDVHFTSSNSLPSSPALVPTRPVSPCSPVARPNFLPRLRTPLAVTQAVKENAKGHNKLQTDHICDKLVDKKLTPVVGHRPRSPSPDPSLSGDENISLMSRPRKRRRLVTKEEINGITEMSKKLRTAWDGSGEASRDQRAA